MPARILVVDDHADTVLLFEGELRAAGYEVTGTTSANEALTIAIATKPDVIVTDLAMPQMDGYELAHLIRSYAATRGIRLVVVSAHPFDPGPTKAPPGGWDAFAKKPIEPGKLASLVRTVLAAPITSVQQTGRIRVPTPLPTGAKRGTDE